MAQQFRCQYCDQLNGSTIISDLKFMDPARSMFIFDTPSQTRKDIIEMQPVEKCLECTKKDLSNLDKGIKSLYYQHIAYKNYSPEVMPPKLEKLPSPPKVTLKSIPVVSLNNYWEEINQLHSEDINLPVNNNFISQWIRQIKQWPGLFMELKEFNINTPPIDWVSVNWLLSEIVLFLLSKPQIININLKWKIKYIDSESSIINIITDEEYPLFYNPPGSTLGSILGLLVDDYELFNHGLVGLLDYIWKRTKTTKNYKRFDSSGILNIKTNKSYIIQYSTSSEEPDREFLEALMILRDLVIN